jgi:hypothetical protein
MKQCIITLRILVLKQLGCILILYIYGNFWLKDGNKITINLQNYKEWKDVKILWEHKTTYVMWLSYKKWCQYWDVTKDRAQWWQYFVKS